MIRKHPNRPGISNVVTTATVENVTVNPPPYDSGIPSTSDTSVMTSTDLAVDGVPLTPVEELEVTSFSGPEVKPREPVVV